MIALRLLLAASLAGLFVAAQQQDPWKAADLIQPEVLAKAKTAPHVFYVGFPVLYRAAHIPGAVMAGPGSRASGLETLRAELNKLPKDAEVVLYCGCCPWDKCPNVRPAFKLAREMGFQKLKLVIIPTNLHTDWVTKGYPVEKSVPAEAQ